MNCFKRAPSAPTDPTDRVIPLHFFDDTPLFARITVYNLHVFDDVLDPEKLHSALENLVQKETWQKLGGRLRRGARGLEYHVPREYSREQRPAVDYSHAKHDANMADHPVASKLPRCSTIQRDTPFIAGGNTDDFFELSCGPGCPRSLGDYLNSDRPVHGLRVVSFSDATLVILHWVHVLADALSIKTIVENWVLMLQGRDAEVTLLHGFDEDPLQELGKNPTEPYLLADSVMPTAFSVMYGLRNGYNFLFGPKEIRMVCIPGPFWKKLHADALAELKVSGVEDPFLTENDVLTAWWTRLSVSHLPPPRPVTVMIAMSLRRVLERDLLPAGRLYVSNCIGFTNVLMEKQELTALSVAALAGETRGAISEQRTRAQAEAYAAVTRRAMYPHPLVPGGGSTYQVTYSNWTQARLFEADFAAAAVRPRETPLFASLISHTQVPFQYPDGFVITGKDSRDNYWIQGYRCAGLWAHI